MKRLLFFTLSFCLGFVVHAEYNVTSVIYDGNGQQCNWWLNNDNKSEESLLEKYMPYPIEEGDPEVSRYLEMTRVQNEGWEWHGIGFDLSGLNTTIGAGNQIALWVKKDIAEDVHVELQFQDGTPAILSEMEVESEDGWKYLVFDFSGQSGDIQGKQLGNMFVQVHTGGKDGQTATISVTGIVKGFDLNDRPDPTANNPIISGSAVGEDKFVMTETLSDIYFWMGSLNAGDLQITMSGESLVAGISEYDPKNVPDVINLVSSSVMSRSTGSVTIKEETKVVLTLDCSSNDGYRRLIINPYPESLYVVGVDSVEDLIPFTNDNGEYVVARYLPPGYNFKISTGNLSKWEPSFVALEVNESSENTYRFDNDNLGQPHKTAYRNSFDIEGKYKDPVEDIWFETPVVSDNQSDNKTYKITVNLTSAYPYILVEETSDISVYVQDKHIIVENVIGEYKIQGLSGGEYHEGIIPVGGTVDELVNCNGIYLVEANGQSKRVLVY